MFGRIDRKRKIHKFLKIRQIKKQKIPLIMQYIINVEKQNFTTTYDNPIVFLGAVENKRLLETTKFVAML